MRTSTDEGTRPVAAAMLALLATLCSSHTAALGAGVDEAPSVSTGSAPDAAAALRLGAEYRAYLNEALTVVRSTGHAIREGTKRGFRLASVDERKKYRPGDRLLFSNADRTVALVIVGKRPASEGLRLVGTHHDTPSLRLEPYPVRAPEEDAGIVHLVAHPYGGIKPYHWERRPVVIAGEVYRRKGARVDVTLGAPGDGFALAVTELETEPEMGAERPKWRTSYRIVAASTPAEGEGIESPFGLTVLRALHSRFGVSEDDLGAADLRVVPAAGARDVGLDRLLVGGWGQDDRLNSYAALRAAIELPGTPPYTAIALLLDREESGSRGTSGMRSEYLELLVSRLLEGTGGGGDGPSVRAALAASFALSADTPAAVNPLFPGVHERKNAARLGRGPAVFKSTGHAGKIRGSDAEPVLIAHVKRIFAAAGIPLQFTELGRVDEGGGGTIARYLARRGVLTLDVGAPVVSMHSPLELSHKHDLWWAVRGFRAFFEDPRSAAEVLGSGR